MSMRKPQEIQELCRLLDESGWNPRICDTAVAFYDTPVTCGMPVEPGDEDKNLTMLPRDFVAMQPEFVVTVRGDSMKDVDIMPGDAVKVTANSTMQDGDIVLIMIDSEITLKTYCQDEEGNPWLVPQNQDYDAFPLSGKLNVWVIGVVTEIIRKAPRVSYRSCIRSINKARQKTAEPRVIEPWQTDNAIRETGSMITVARQWYAVYRAMADLNVVDTGDFDTFCTMVRKVLPHHAHLPVRDEMQRMAIMSFVRPVELWRQDNAPVQGKRFNDYQRIALRTKELLTSQ